MKFSSDELMPFSDVRTGLSHFLVSVQAGKEIVITRHGKPIAALVAASQLYRYRELERVMGEMTAMLASKNEMNAQNQTSSTLMKLVLEAQQLLSKPLDSNS